MRPTFSPAAAAVAVTTAGMLPVYLLGGLAVQVRADLELDRSAVGALVAIFFVAAAVGSFTTGRLADRVGPTRVMRASAAVSATSLLGAALCGGVGWLATALVVGGLANGAGQPASNALISRAVAAHRRGLAFGAKQAAIPLSVLLGGLAVPVFGVTVGWRWAFVAGALLAAAVAAGVPGSRPAGDRPGRSRDPQRRPPPAGVVRAAAARAADAAGPYRRFPLAVLAVGVTLGAAVGNAFGAFYVETAVAAAVTPATAGLFAAAGSAVGIAVRLTLGALADRRTARYLAVVAAMMATGALACGLLATGRAGLMFPAVVLAYGLGWAWAGLFTYAIALTHPKHIGRATGITQGGVATGGALGPLAFGQLADHASLSAAWLATGCCALLAAVAVLTGRGLLLRHRPELVVALRTRQKRRSAARRRRTGAAFDEAAVRGPGHCGPRFPPSGSCVTALRVAVRAG